MSELYSLNHSKYQCHTNSTLKVYKSIIMDERIHQINYMCRYHHLTFPYIMYCHFHVFQADTCNNSFPIHILSCHNFYPLNLFEISMDTQVVHSRCTNQDPSIHIQGYLLGHITREHTLQRHIRMLR
ncbi:hypothetical protein EPI10_024305 [Gossypium australe]|uniref:Uncharacterized protein n=1 Tax=Gossypium australe TaxID=47621 RepID=A0A5B6VXF3_9ROSI|nr:hypothetical protein EPI10_024305 [Gossypium australe]